MTTTAGPFVIKNGSLILKDGKLLVGDPSCCCDQTCCVVNHVGDGLAGTPTMSCISLADYPAIPYQWDPETQEVVTIPAQCSACYTVKCSVGSDIVWYGNDCSTCSQHAEAVCSPVRYGPCGLVDSGCVDDESCTSCDNKGPCPVMVWTGYDPDWYCSSLGCKCDTSSPIGTICAHRIPSNGQPCPDGDRPQIAGDVDLKTYGCWNIPGNPNWCECISLANNANDCFENYEFSPPGFDEFPPDCTGFTNANGGCGGNIVVDVASCIPGVAFL